MHPKDEKTAQIVVIGAILVQRTSWSNAEKALIALKDVGLLDLERIVNTPITKLTQLIRVAGFYSTKPRRLQSIAHYIVENYGNIATMQKADKNQLRSELLNVYGIGNETADTILLFALNKPSFIVDAYTMKFLNKYAIAHSEKYEVLQEEFQSVLPYDSKVYQEYHILKIVDIKGIEESKMSVVE